MKRKILLLVLFAFLYIGLTSHANVYADENIREKNVENVAKYALSFVNAICGEKGLTSGEVLEIKDETDSLSGYCIDILDHQTSYGYVIVDLPAIHSAGRPFYFSDIMVNDFTIFFKFKIGKFNTSFKKFSLK